MGAAAEAVAGEGVAVAKKGAGDILRDTSVLKGEEEGEAAAAAAAEAVAGKDVAMKGHNTAASFEVENKKASEMYKGACRGETVAGGRRNDVTRGRGRGKERDRRKR